MRKIGSIGAALFLALCSNILTSCSRTASPLIENQSGSSEAQNPTPSWNKKTETQLLAAIAQAPADGLKPDLFLKGDLPKNEPQRSAVLTKVALSFAAALAHGYADPRKISSDYTIPRPGTDVKQGLVKALASGSVGEWLASLPPQTEEYQALSKSLETTTSAFPGSHRRFVQLAILPMSPLGSTTHAPSCWQ